MIVHKKSCYTTKTHPSAALRLSWSRQEWHSKQKQLLHSKSDIDEDDQMTRICITKERTTHPEPAAKTTKSFEEMIQHHYNLQPRFSDQWSRDTSTPPFWCNNPIAYQPEGSNHITACRNWDIQGSKLIRMPLSFSPSFGCRLYSWQSGEFAPELLGLAV